MGNRDKQGKEPKKPKKDKTPAKTTMIMIGVTRRDPNDRERSTLHLYPCEVAEGWDL